MRIGDLAKRAEVTPRTVRYYESLGLIPAGEREGTSQHRYPEQTIARLQKIDELKRLGLSLDEIRGVIDLYFTDPSGRQPKRKILALLRRHLAETEDQLAVLGRFRADLLGHIKRFEDWFDKVDKS